MSLPPLLTRTLVLSALLALGSTAPAGAASNSKSAAKTTTTSGSTTSGSTNTGSSNPDVDSELPGEILLKLRSTQGLQPLLARYPLTLASRFGARPIYRLKVVGNVQAKDLLPALALEPEVLIAEANVVNRNPEARRNFPWAIGNPDTYVNQWAPQAMHLADAQQLSTGAGVRVAVLDSGIDAGHPMLAGKLLPGRDFVDDDNNPAEVATRTGALYGHGTHVAGLVAMVAPNAKIMPVRVLDPDGMGNAWVLAEALLWAIDPDGNPATDDGAQIVNLSLGSLGRTRILSTIAQIASCTPAVNDDPIGDRSDPGYTDDNIRCANQNNKGVLVVAAAGNDSSDRIKEYPAAESAYGLVAVAASNNRGRLASFSNTGNWIDLAAPGEGLTSSIPGGVATWSGTSMAAPMVAGVAALLRSREPALTAKDVVTRLKRTGGQMCGVSQVQVDALAALRDVTAAPVVCR